jgi:hypothetical protein
MPPRKRPIGIILHLPGFIITAILGYTSWCVNQINYTKFEVNLALLNSTYIPNCRYIPN